MDYNKTREVLAALERQEVRFGGRLMPVRRFRSVEEMEGNTCHDRNDPRLFRAIQNTWEFAQRVTQPQFPPGVYKHRNVEEAEELRQVWEKANFAAFHARRLASA